MLIPFEVTFDFEPLACDGSNYNSWSAHVLDIFRAMGSQIEQVVDVRICSPNLQYSKLTIEERKCSQLNSHATYILTRALSEEVYNVLDALMDKDDDRHISLDAHRVWIALKEMYIPGSLQEPIRQDELTSQTNYQESNQ
uniref:DUF4219 domain-containing protein n=1 Tax=Setaria italica TaxID=4555 RepID=K3Y320_SETIT